MQIKAAVERYTGKDKLKRQKIAQFFATELSAVPVGQVNLLSYFVLSFHKADSVYTKMIRPYDKTVTADTDTSARKSPEELLQVLLALWKEKCGDAGFVSSVPAAFMAAIKSL